MVLTAAVTSSAISTTDHVGADVADRLVEVDLAPIDLDPARVPDGIGDVLGRDRPEQAPVVAGLLGNREHGPAEHGRALARALLGLAQRALGASCRRWATLIEARWRARRACAAAGSCAGTRPTRRPRSRARRAALRPGSGLPAASPAPSQRSRSRSPVAIAATTTMVSAAFGHVRQQRKLPGPLDGASHLALMPTARSGDPPRADLAAIGDESAQHGHVLVVHLLHLVPAVRTRLAAGRSRPALAVAPAHRSSALLCHGVQPSVIVGKLPLEGDVVVASSGADRRALEVAGIDRDVALLSRVSLRRTRSRFRHRRRRGRRGTARSQRLYPLIGACCRSGRSTRATAGVRRLRSGVPWRGTRWQFSPCAPHTETSK